MKDHERLSEKALRARALLHMMRPLVREKKIDQKAKRVVTSLQQLEKMNPNKAHARHMYLRHSVKEAMEAGPGDAASRLRDSRQCMSSHSQAFEALAAPERRQFEEARATHVASRWDNIKAAQAALVVKLRRLHQKEAEAVKSNGVPNHIAQARLNDRELESACEFFDSPGCQKLRLEAGPLGAFGLAPSAPSQAEQGVLRAVEDGLPQVDEAEPPWWCRSICRIRDCFWETAIGLEEEGGFWLVLFAKKSPPRVHLLAAAAQDDRGGLERWNCASEGSSSSGSSPVRVPPPDHLHRAGHSLPEGRRLRHLRSLGLPAARENRSSASCANGVRAVPVDACRSQASQCTSSRSATTSGSGCSARRAAGGVPLAFGRRSSRRLPSCSQACSCRRAPSPSSRRSWKRER